MCSKARTGSLRSRYPTVWLAPAAANECVSSTHSFLALFLLPSQLLDMARKFQTQKCGLHSPPM